MAPSLCKWLSAARFKTLAKVLRCSQLEGRKQVVILVCVCRGLDQLRGGWEVHAGRGGQRVGASTIKAAQRRSPLSVRLDFLLYPFFACAELMVALGLLFCPYQGTDSNKDGKSPSQVVFNV